MDANITKALNDKLYDKRKSGALELEGLIRDALAVQESCGVRAYMELYLHTL